MAFTHMKSSEWDATAKEYASLPIEGPLSIPCRRMLEAMDAAYPFSTASAILDIGCGPGTATSMLIQNYGHNVPAKARLIASDFSKAMVEATRAKGEKIVAGGGDISGCWARLETEAMDAQDLAMISSDSMSHVLGSLVYFMLPDAQKGLVEAKRVLKEGGVFACTNWAKADWMQFLSDAGQKVRPGMQKRFDPAMFGLWKETQSVKRELEVAGFRDIHVEYIDVDLPVEDPSKFVNGFIRTKNPGAKIVVGDFSDEELDRCCEEWMKIVEGNDGKCRGVAVLGIGRK